MVSFSGGMASEKIIKQMKAAARPGMMGWLNLMPKMCIRDSYTGTDHTREQVPFIAYSPSMEGGKDLGSADTFAVIGATVADNFGVKMPEGTIGTSVLNEL